MEMKAVDLIAICIFAWRISLAMTNKLVKNFYLVSFCR